MGWDEMSGHTPGPWTFEERRLCQFGVHAQRLPRGGMNRRICLTNSPRTYKNEALDLENEANARLIAAAPDTAAERDRLQEVNTDLLAALKLAEPLLADSGFTKSMEAHAAIRAAIAKADRK